MAQLRPRHDLTVDKVNRRAEHGAGTYGRLAFQDHAGEERDVGSKANGSVQIGPLRVPHGDAPAHPEPVDACPQLRLGRGELSPVVHLQGLDRVRHHDRGHRVAGVVEDRDRVGQVVLAERVVGRQPAQSRSQDAVPEAVDARRDLVDLALGVGGVRLVDDAGHTAVLVKDDPRVAVRLAEPCGEQRRSTLVRPMTLDERRERPPGQQAACRRAAR